MAMAVGKVNIHLKMDLVKDDVEALVVDNYAQNVLILVGKAFIYLSGSL